MTVRDGLERVLSWLEGTPVAETVRTLPWAYPGLESAHIIGIALFVGVAAVFDLRLLGAARGIPVSTAARSLLPWSWVGFGIVASSGFLMLMANAVSLADNPALQLKALLILLAGLNAAGFHLGPYRTIGRWEGRDRSPGYVKVPAIASLLLWPTIIVCGRLIAYV
ncbi:DUF6644 family protein [Actinopolymorpha alba]|uniref:DUF6644 family protein n=1 Tax=Actinopolymorpha alba TaxID=533267 RepID=UPI0003639D06|nr:DUF6644 family protein [Actinopolymorpha alba]